MDPVRPAAPEVAEVLGQLLERCLEDLPARDDDGVDTSRPSLGLLTEHLSNQTFSSISLDRITDLPGRDDAEARYGAAVGENEQCEVPAVETGTAVEDVLELGPLADPLLPGEADGRRRVTVEFG